MWNDAASRVFGYSAEEMLGRNIDRIVPSAFRHTLHESRAAAAETGYLPFGDKSRELVGLRKSGDEFPIELSLSMWREDGVATFGAIIRDITERSRYERDLFQLAHFDALTGLPNRQVLHRRLEEEIAVQQPMAILSVDIDGFKVINDTLGHRVGDLLLRHAASRLKDCLRPIDTVSRLGGDEFAILLPGVGDPLRAAMIAEAAIAALSHPLTIGGHDVQVSACAGIAIYPGHSLKAEELLGNADLALHHAKRDGKGVRRLFTPAMRHAAVARRQNDVEVRRALDNREFRVFYQPQVRLADNAIVGAEALLRWRHPERGLLSPGAFLPMIENGLLSATIGQWVLEEACAQAAAWRQAGAADFRIGVNLFGAQFHTGDLVEDTMNALAGAALPPCALELEITENIILNQDDAIVPPLTRLRAYGVGVAFDDYGTGFASLSMLKRFPISRLKIDQTFVRDMCSDAADAAVVRAILFLGESFGMEVIAEGVETAEQHQRLVALTCVEGQGYLFGKPLDAPDFADTLIAPARRVTA